MERNYECMEKLRSLLKASICTISYESMRHFASTALAGYGASDEATMMMFGGTIKCLLNEIGVDVSSNAIAAITPSPRTLRRAELRLAVDCFL
jgi:hypothetical protein